MMHEKIISSNRFFLLLSVLCVYGFSVAQSNSEFIIITPTANNLASILQQKYSHFEVFYVSSVHDNQLEQLRDIPNCDQIKPIAITNERLGFEGTVWHIIHTIPDHKIVLILGENDYFTSSEVLSELASYYENKNIWMTCNQLYDRDNNQKSSLQESYALISNTNVRKHRLISSEPITFYVWLFKQIKLQDLLVKNDFFSQAFVHAYTYPMLEMAKNHVACVEKSLIESESYEIDEESNEYEILHTMPTYEPLPSIRKISYQNEQADLVVFSFNRPIQLYAFLESLERYTQGLSSITIVYRISNKQMKKAYKKVQKRFPTAFFIQQNSQADFKEKTLQAISKGISNYLVFAVDDIIVKDNVNISECIDFLKKTHAHGFYLRLGKNITYCYMNKRNQKIPDLLPVENIYAWRFRESESDWCSPNTVDMTVYERKKILPILENLSFTSPNILEGAWANSANRYNDLEKIGLCFETSKIINIPLNQVQNHSGCRLSMNVSVQDLLKKFNAGYKIDIQQFNTIENNSPHMEYMPLFIKR